MISVYKNKKTKTVTVPDDEDLTEFKTWAKENNIWYSISKTNMGENDGRVNNSSGK
jgi:hypothetical protein